MTFQIGEKVVYPNYGVGTIENISTRVSGTRPERFYLLRLTVNNMTVMVPCSHAGDVGLRKVTKTSELAKMFCFLAGGACRSNRDWKDRFKENSEKMQHGSILEIAEVLKGLLIQQQLKPLSFREKKMLDRARQMLITEVCTVKSLRESDSIQLLDQALAKSNLRFPLPM
ncbi:CarD family transcriptional regulator [Bryobacterales bacterium F-183]|nr:CarD family transcriptional regulator [Bryobacterales bacterium F-183]